MIETDFEPSIALRVSDLEEVRPFYERVVGLVPLEASDRRVALGASEDDGPIVVLEEAPNADERSRDAAGLFHLAIRLPTRESLSEALRRVSQHQYGLTGASDHHVSEALYTDDPAGNGVELYVDRPRSSWEWDEEGEVEMTTERLDVDELWRVSGGMPPERAPAETVLGHVHLEVTDLEEAVDFYCGVAGMEVQARRPGAAFVSYDGYHHHVGLNTWNHRRRGHADDRLGLARMEARVGPERLAEVADRAEEAGRAIGRDDEGVLMVDPDRIPWRFRRRS